MKEYENRGRRTHDPAVVPRGHTRSEDISGRRTGRVENCSYYIGFEGFTECSYFDMLRNNRSKIGISSSIDIINLIRFDQESDKSGVYWNLNSMEDYRTLVKTGYYNVYLFVGDIVQQIYDYMHSEDMHIINNVATSQSERKRLRGVFKERWGRIKKSLFKVQMDLINELKKSDHVNGKRVTDMDEATELCRSILSKHEQYAEASKFLRKPQRKKKESFNDKSDIFCFVFDRDRKCKDRDTKDKFEQFVRTCDEHCISPYMSNPAFELWIIMHFEELKHVLANEKELLDNPKSERNGEERNYAEWILDDFFEFGYQKGLRNTEMFTKDDCQPVKHALDVAQSYEFDDIRQLEDKLGTNVNQLINRMQDNR